MANIPPEIWLHIAKFIPKYDLPGLLGVNSTFFNIAMDIRYREIVISTTNMKTLKRLSYPLVASRVYRLELRLSDVRIRGPSANTSGSRIRRQLKHAITRIFGGSKSPPIIVPLTGLIKEIINIVNKLVNVRELYIDLPPSYDLQPLFSSFWSSFGPKLYNLSLSGILEDFCTLINPKLDGLQELHVEVTRSRGHVSDAHQAILVDVLLPFINNLAPHLLSLTLWSRTSLDPSTFFAQLAPFPYLKALIIRVPFNQASGDTSGLKDLICDRSGTPQRVELRWSPGPAGLMVDPSSETPLSRWLLECISDKHLQVLDFFPRNTTAEMEFLLDCIQRTSQTLAEPSMRDRLLQGGGIEAVINVATFRSDLTHLKINIRKLDVVLTDHLALKLPKIERFRLSVQEYAINGPLAHYYLLNTFVQDLHTRSYLYQLEVHHQY